MPDRSQYNTRLRTNSLILPPRRLRHSPPPLHHRQPRNSKLSITSPLPPFPPPNVVLHPDDAANKTFIAIGRAMLAVDNRAITIKDLSQLSLDCGLLCQNVSAASQAITTFIRNHLSRCHQQRAKPLLLSLALTGTPDDDRLAPALHSRSGGTSHAKEQDHFLTRFRRGTTVWYLSELAGAPCPFKRAGLRVEDILGACQGAKRKRDSPQYSLPRKIPTGPPMATRNQAAQLANPHLHPARLRVKLTLHVPDSRPDHPDDPDDDDDSDDNDSDDDALSPLSDRASLSPPPSPAPCPSLPPYPILSPSIPSPASLTPNTTLASPSAPSASFPFLPSALSNPTRDFRSRSCSLPFSSASPPPDSEDEDHDFHNSMVGLRRGSLPPLKTEDVDDWSTSPLELLPGFEHSPVKAEPTSVVLPPSPNKWERWDLGPDHTHVKHEIPPDQERTILVPEEERHPWGDKGAGTRDDPVRIDDVEVLGPETVRSREWDVAWDMQIESDGGCSLHPKCSPEEDDMRASPAETLDTVPTAVSSPPSSSEEFSHFDVERDDAPFIMHPLKPCDPPVVATVIDGIPVFHTLLAPNLHLLRRIDTPLVTLSPLLTFLGFPPTSSQNTWVPLSVAHSLAVHGSGKDVHVPRGVLDVFLQADLGRWFPGVGIRVEDVVASRGVGAGMGGSEDAPTEAVVSAAAFEAPAMVTVEVGPVVGDEQEQEDALFRSFVDFVEPGPCPCPVPPPMPPPATEKELPPPKCVDSVPSKVVQLQIPTTHAKENAEKENAVANAATGRRKREKGEVQLPVRRSKRLGVGVGSIGGAVTRARSKARVSV